MPPQYEIATLIVFGLFLVWFISAFIPKETEQQKLEREWDKLEEKYLRDCYKNW